MPVDIRSGSLNYTQNSGSFYAGSAGAFGRQTESDLFQTKGTRPTINFEKPSTTTTVTVPLTVKYFQRVFDDGTEGYCYYIKTSVDPTPSSGETTPNYTGTISDHAIVKILEIF